MPAMATTRRASEMGVHAPRAAYRPRVAIITVTYNRAHKLVRAIRSVLSQEYEDLRLIVVDDGSTDETEAVIAQYRDDKRLTVIRHEHNLGVLAARNTGLDSLREEDVLFGYLDSDDTLVPGAVETMVKALTESGQYYSMVWAASRDSATGRPDGWHSLDRGEITFDDQLGGRVQGDFMQLVRRELIDGLRYLPKAGGGEGHLWTRVLRHAPAVVIPDVVQSTDRSGGDRVSIVSFTRTEAEKRMWTYIYELRCTGRDLRGMYPKRYADLLRRLSLEAAMAEDTRRARPMSRQALRLNPVPKSLIAALLVLAPGWILRPIIRTRALIRARGA